MTQEQTAITLPGGQYYYGTGRRKTTIARVRLYPGSGNYLINERPYLEIFTRPLHQNRLRLPFEAAELMGNFDVYAKVAGGGVSAWADAIAPACSPAIPASKSARSPALNEPARPLSTPSAKSTAIEGAAHSVLGS